MLSIVSLDNCPNQNPNGTRKQFSCQPIFWSAARIRQRNYTTGKDSCQPIFWTADDRFFGVDKLTDSGYDGNGARSISGPRSRSRTRSADPGWPPAYQPESASSSSTAPKKRLSITSPNIFVRCSITSLFSSI